MSIHALSSSSLKLNRAQPQLDIIRSLRASSSAQTRFISSAKPAKKFVAEELEPGDLAGTVRHHENYVILHHPLRPTEQPHGMTSPLFKKVKSLMGDRTTVNVGWTSDVWTTEKEGIAHQRGDEHERRSGRWLNPQLRSRNISPNPNIKGKEIVDMSIYSTHHPWTSRVFSFDPEAVDGTPGSLEMAVRSWTSDIQALHISKELQGIIPDQDLNPHPIDIFICTHGQRDCRCGETGTAFADALRAEVRKWQEAVKETESSALIPIRIGELAHVGRHE